MTEEVERRYVVCKIKSGYETVFHNIWIYVFFAAMLALGCVWLFFNVKVNLVLLGFVDPVLFPDLEAWVLTSVGLLFINILLSALLWLNDVDKKAHVEAGGELIMTGLSTIFAISNLICGLYRIIVMGPLIFVWLWVVIVLVFGYIVAYNLCEIRLWLAGVGRYAKSAEHVGPYAETSDEH